MVILSSEQEAAQTQDAILRSVASARHKGEFKFNKCCDEVRDLFFEAIAGSPFRVRAIVVKKAAIYSPRLKADKDKFYEYFVKSMVKYNGGALRGARVVIDGSGDREFRKNLNTALRRRAAIGAIRDVRFKDSKSDPLIQLADMCAGAIARSYREQRDNCDRWRKMLAPLIEDVWEFR
jgi:hypothetical protein